MLGNRKLIVDTHSEIYNLLQADGIFWNLQEHVQKNQVVPNSVYVIGREQASRYPALVHDLIQGHGVLVVYSNPTEGSEPMEWNLRQAGYLDRLAQKQMVVITGGSINPELPHLLYETFMCKVHDYDENLEAIKEYSAKQHTQRPYKFLFLNGRMREHRKYLLTKFKQTGLLDQALWSNLDSSVGVGPMHLTPAPAVTCPPGTFPVHYLPAQYEVDRYREHTQVTPESVTGRLEGKFNLFKHEWGEIYLNTQAYLDTYFSLVTETVFDYPCSFRTEKIWKPIAIGHPFVVASGSGYYRDLHNMGFRTFGHLIDESFDQIDHNPDRIDRIVEVVQDLCTQDLSAFVTAAQDVCKYNQQLIEELRLKTRAEFPDRFFHFVNTYINE